MVITPTVGRVVWYVPSEYDGFQHDNTQFCAAIVTYVHSDRLVNLVVWDHNGNGRPRNSVTLVQETDDTPRGAYCQWMPYQLGQAKKHSEEK